MIHEKIHIALVETTDRAILGMITLEVLGRPPKRAEFIERGGLRVIVRKLRRRRLTEAFISR